MTDEPQPAPSPEPSPEPSPPPPRRRSRRWLAALIALVVLVGAILFGALPRLARRDRVRTETADQAIPYVSVVRPERVSPAQKIVLPGNVQPYTSAPIFARATGYVRTWRVDIGAQVKQGQLLAELEIPEVEQQLKQARGTLATAQANLRLAEATAKRFTDLGKTRAVSQQEIDNAVGSLQANQATVTANEANVRELEQLVSYARIVAPFDGIITARNVDIGDLVTAGTGATPNTALFQITRSDTLRVYVSVPEAYAQMVQPGMVAELTLVAFPGNRITGKLVRTASAIDTATRTLLVEIQVPNPTLKLFSGAFAEVQLAVPAPRDMFTVPVEALLFRKEGLLLATVVNNRVVLKPITPARDFGETMEVSDGLTGNEVVIISPPDSITDGATVRIRAAQARRSR